MSKVALPWTHAEEATAEAMFEATESPAEFVATTV